MKRLNVVSLAVAVTVVAIIGLVGNAQAQKFDDVARGAEWVPSKKALAPLFWAFATDCTRHKNDLARRQCTLISSSRKKTITGKRFLVEADKNALQLSEYDAKTKKVSIDVKPCLACATPLKIAGQDIYVIGANAKNTKATKTMVDVSTMSTVTKSFETKKRADKWRAAMLKRARTQFVVEIPSKVDRWKTGNKSGVKVKIVGFRVYDPCDGRIVSASPKARRERPDRRACSGNAIVADSRATDTTSTAKSLPRRLNTRQIARALRPALRRARKCKDTFGMTGTARFTITISGDGRIIGLKESGDFVDTPTGDCVAKEVKKVRFPKSKTARTTITYPVILQ